MKELKGTIKMLLVLVMVLFLGRGTVIASDNTIECTEGDTVYQDENVSIVLERINAPMASWGDETYYIHLTMTNTSQRTLKLSVNEVSVNEFIKKQYMWEVELEPGQSVKTSNKGIYEKEAPNRRDIKYLGAKFSVYDVNDQDFFYDSEFKVPYVHVHKYDRVEEVVKATCTEKGILHHVCICSDYYETDIPATGHKYSAWKILIDSSCASKGIKDRYCIYCYKNQQKAIPINPKAHSWSQWLTAKTVLFTKNGIKIKKEDPVKTCYQCGIKIKAKVTLSHKKKTLKKGKSFYLRAKKITKGDKISKYTTSNKKVAIVNKKGKVVAKKKGTAKITLKMKSGCKAVCKVTVK